MNKSGHLQLSDTTENHFVRFLGQKNFDLGLHSPQHMFANDVSEGNGTRITANCYIIYALECGCELKTHAT